MSGSQNQDYTIPARNSRVIRLPVEQNEYKKIVNDSICFRNWLDCVYTQHPELFPESMSCPIPSEAKHSHLLSSLA